MEKSALVLAALLFLLPIVSANVLDTKAGSDHLAYYCQAQSNLGIKWQYLHGDVHATVTALYVDPLAAIQPEIMQNEDVCWQSGAKIRITPYAGGTFAENSANWRGYIAHPPVAWLGGITSPPYSTTSIFSMPSSCVLSTGSANTLNSYLTTLPSYGITYIKSTNIQSDYSPPCGPAPNEWCYCAGVETYDDVQLQPLIPPTVPPYPPNWLACQSGIGAGMVICRGEARIYETTTGSDVLKKTIPLEGTGAQAQLTLAQQDIDISSPGVKKFRTDLFVYECGIYTVSDSITPRFYGAAYLAEGVELKNYLLKGTELSFNAKSCASCNVVADTPNSADCSSGHDFPVKVTYANVPAGSSIRLIPDIPGQPPSPNPISISGTGEITPHSLTTISYTSTSGTYNIFGKMTIPGIGNVDCGSHASVSCTAPPSEEMECKISPSVEDQATYGIKLVGTEFSPFRNDIWQYESNDCSVKVKPDKIVMDYKGIASNEVFPGQKNGHLSCTYDIYDTQGAIHVGAISGVSTGYGGTDPPIIFKSTDPTFTEYCDYPATEPATDPLNPPPVHGRLLKYPNDAIPPSLILHDCKMEVKCVAPGTPSCKLSVEPAGSDTAVCNPPHAFNIRVTYANVKGGDKLVVDGTSDANPPPGGKYLLTKTNLDNCGDKATYCDGPFTYSAVGNYPITGCIIKSGWGSNSAKTCANVGDPDVIPCNPPEDVTCTASQCWLDVPNSDLTTRPCEYTIRMQHSDITLPASGAITIFGCGNIGPFPLTNIPPYTDNLIACDEGSYIAQGTMTPNLGTPITCDPESFSCPPLGTVPCEEYI